MGSAVAKKKFQRGQISNFFFMGFMNLFVIFVEVWKLIKYFGLIFVDVIWAIFCVTWFFFFFVNLKENKKDLMIILVILILFLIFFFFFNRVKC